MPKALCGLSLRRKGLMPRDKRERFYKLSPADRLTKEQEQENERLVERLTKEKEQRHGTAD